jgi:hypothetical protein
VKSLNTFSGGVLLDKLYRILHNKQSKLTQRATIVQGLVNSKYERLQYFQPNRLMLNREQAESGHNFDADGLHKSGLSEHPHHEPAMSARRESDSQYGHAEGVELDCAKYLKDFSIAEVKLFMDYLPPLKVEDISPVNYSRFLIKLVS